MLVIDQHFHERQKLFMITGRQVLREGQSRRLQLYFKYHNWFVGVCMVCALGFLGLEIHRQTYVKLLAEQPGQASAKVTAKFRDTPRGNAGRSPWMLEYSYSVPGNASLFSGKDRVPRDVYESHGTGDTITITYARAAPAWSEIIKGSLARENRLGFFSVIGFSALTILLLCERWFREWRSGLSS